MKSVVASEIVDAKTLDYFEFSIALADASYGNAQSAAEETVFDGDVGAVAFDGQAVVSVVDAPVREGDVGGANVIGPVRVGCVPGTTS